MALGNFRSNLSESDLQVIKIDAIALSRYSCTQLGISNFSLAMLTGMRRKEISKLEDRDIDFIQRIITLRKPKGKKTVSIPLSKPVAKFLKDQQAWRDENFSNSPFVFPGKNGLKRVDCSAVYRIKRKADLPKKFRIFHGLRHHFAVTLANSGEYSLDMIGQLLTHKSNEMTRRYAKFLPNTIKDASERAANLIEVSIKKR